MGKLEQLQKDIPTSGVFVNSNEKATYGKIMPERGRSEEERDLLTATKDIFDQIDQQGGIDPATVLNMHPWEIHSTGPHLEGIVIPACPIGQPYYQYVQKDIRIDRADKSGRFIPTPVWPIMLMRDVVRQHENWGGLVVYMGELRLGASKRNSSQFEILAALIEAEKDTAKRQMLEQLKVTTPRDQRYATDKDVQRLIETASQRQIEYYRKRCTLVSSSYASDSKTAYRIISPADRLMARWLHNRGIYATLPQWVVDERPDTYQPLTCPKCGKDVEVMKNESGEQKPKGFACTTCSYILDGIRAYVAGEIGEDHVSLKRNSREELDAAGLKHVKTLAEEREAAEKAKAKAEKAK